MRRTLSSVTVAALVLVAAAARAETDRPQVHTGESPPARAWRQAMEAGDLAALARMHDAKTVAFPPDATMVRGQTEILKGYVALFKAYTVSVTVDEASWMQEGPLVVSWGRTTLTLHPRAGGAVEVKHARFTDAAVAQGNGWVYVVDHASRPAGP